MKVKEVVLIIVLVLFIFLLNFKLLVYNTGFYDKEIDRLNITISRELAETNINNLISYFKDEKELTTNFFNEKEKLHLKDVKGLINKTLALFYIILILLIILIASNYKNLKKPFILSGSITILIILLFYLINFENFFNNTFHKVLFNNDLYLLDPAKDNLINLFPYEFFQDFAYKLFINSFITSLILITIGFILKRKNLFNIFPVKSK
ncbi:TIGR01906 family membrane protein [Candidatus Woesearchaeota archaeon]|nr:TIGR01906 family membrane protein [Candidatus Woesearchaeota archaeon]